jgi:hypothetical protein
VSELSIGGGAERRRGNGGTPREVRLYGGRELDADGI